MMKRKKPYKSTKNVLIPDVPKPICNLSDSMNRMGGIADKSLSKTEFYNALVKYAYAQCYGQEAAQERLSGFEETERNVAAYHRQRELD